ncbi:MAG: hypothetical protein IJF76_02650 [Clostridia bacterium]|nr:hypothetical protein [Clostridia bacterium]
MTKNVFKFIYTTFMKVLLIVMTVLFSACALKNILAFCGAFGWTSTYLWLDVIGLVLCVLLIVVLLLMLTHSRYVVTNFSLYVKMGLFIYKIPCGLIQSIVKIEQDGSLFILFVNQKAQPAQMKINIVESDYDGFIKSLRDYNVDIFYETYNKDSETK